GTKTSATLGGDEWVINGAKCFITNATYAKNVAITAVTDRSKGTSGISSRIIPTNIPGFTIKSDYAKMGVRASNTTVLIFDHVRIPKENLLGKEGEGFKQFLVTLDGGRIGIAAMAVGLAQGAYEKALRYSKERKQFGSSLSKFQAIQF